MCPPPPASATVEVRGEARSPSSFSASGGCHSVSGHFSLISSAVMVPCFVLARPLAGAASPPSVAAFFARGLAAHRSIISLCASCSRSRTLSL
jgi:hypothetical protein